MRIVTGAIKFALAAILVAVGGTFLFLVGDRGKHDSLLNKRRDAVWALVRGVIGLSGGWLIWLATGQSLWILIPLTIWPVSLYLIISGITDLVLTYTRDRELLRREKAQLWSDRLITAGAWEAKKNHDLMRKAGMTEEEIERWAGQRFDKLQRELDKSLLEPVPTPDPLPPAPWQEGVTRYAPGSMEGSLRRRDSAIGRSSKAFFACWREAGGHLNSIGQAVGIEWHKATLEPEFLEHLSFRVGNQLFFVRVDDVDGHIRGPGTMGGLSAVADGCGGHPCIMPMRRKEMGWGPARPGWGLIDARTGEEIDPPALITDELIEMTDWEVQDFAVQVVRNALKEEGHAVLSSQGNPRVDPSIWFMKNGERAWVSVRAVRFPELAAELPGQWRQIASACAKVSRIGYFASVAVAGGEEAVRQLPYTRLLRGYQLFARYGGLHRPTAAEIDAAEEDFVGRGRLASRHRRPPPPR